MSEHNNEALMMDEFKIPKSITCNVIDCDGRLIFQNVGCDIQLFYAQYIQNKIIYNEYVKYTNKASDFNNIKYHFYALPHSIIGTHTVITCDIEVNFGNIHIEKVSGEIIFSVKYHKQTTFTGSDDTLYSLIVFFFFLNGYMPVYNYSELYLDDEIIGTHKIQLIDKYILDRGLNTFALINNDKPFDASSSYEKFLEIKGIAGNALDVYLAAISKVISAYDLKLSLILNSMEGLIKKLHLFDLIYFGKPERRKIVNSIIEILNIELDKDVVKEKICLDLKDESIMPQVLQRIKESLSHINDLTFAEALAAMVKSNPQIDLIITTLIKDKGRFFKKCKNHRNHFAHLTEENNQISDPYELYFICSLLIPSIQLIFADYCGIEIDRNKLSRFITSLKNWREGKDLSI